MTVSTPLESYLSNQANPTEDSFEHGGADSFAATMPASLRNERLVGHDRISSETLFWSGSFLPLGTFLDFHPCAESDFEISVGKEADTARSTRHESKMTESSGSKS